MRLIVILLLFGEVFAQLIPSMGSYPPPPCNVPPFISETITPNVMMIVDNSGSMRWNAYSASYDDTYLYYGYAEPESAYQYDSSHNLWKIVHNWSGTADFSNLSRIKLRGNVWNFMYSRRVDVVRKVLTGGRVLSSYYNDHYVFDEEYNGSSTCYKYIWADDGCYYRIYMYAQNPSTKLYKVWKRRYCSYGSWITKGYPKSYGRIESIVDKTEDVTGVIHKIYDKVKLGIMHFHTSHGGYVKYACGGATLDQIVDDINTMQPNTWTPLAETFYEATKYFQATRGVFNNVNYATMDPIDGWCQKNFVIVVTDGGSTQDTEIPSWLRDYDNDGNDGSYYDSYGTNYLDDVCLWAHITDLRDDYERKQVITTYTIYAFGTYDYGYGLLADAAKNGAFDDKNGNDYPDLPEEYDQDGDSVPDGFFFATNGYLLEEALTNVFVDLLRRATSASAVSVVSQTSKGEGVVFQGYFQPSKFVGSAQLSWIGNLQALWVDPYGNIREDTDEDHRLDMQDDYIADIYFDPSENKTVIKFYKDTDGDGDPDEYKGIGDLDVIHAVWRAGEQLKNKSPYVRSVFAVSSSYLYEISGGEIEPMFPDSTRTNGNMGVTALNFDPSNASVLKPFLDVTSDEVAESLIQYVRGVDFSYTRSRSIGSDVWKLGDIIHSSPIYVGSPSDRYDLIYNDVSYSDFYRRYKDRQPVVYVGANDGMIHCFNAGRYIERSSGQQMGYLKDYGTPLGSELWALIPFELLPHLKWLTDPNYCHVNYVDLTGKVFDAKVFGSSEIHPNGWGTLALFGMRLGGSDYTLSSPYMTLRSAYVLMDITDPTQAGVIAEFTSPDIGFTTVIPGVALVDSVWFLIIGNGPTDMVGLSSEYAKIFAISVNDLVQHRDTITFGDFETYDDNSHLGGISPVDVDLDGSVDVIYITASKLNPVGNWEGKIYRLVTNGSVDPGDWNLSVLINVPAPITVKPAVSLDESGNLWVYAGTGRYFSDQDEQDISQQYFFGVKDPYWETGGDSVYWDDLLDVSSASVNQSDTGTYVFGLETTPISYDSLRVSIRNLAGWKTQLENLRERVINPPILIGGVVFFTTFVPSEDICAFGGTSRLYGVDYLTGVPGENSILGMDDDGWLWEYVEIGEGVPSTPAAHIGIGDEATLMVQLSTGTISSNKASIASPKSKAIFWRGK